MDHSRGGRFVPSGEFASLARRGLMPEDASIAAGAPRFADYPFKLGVASGDPHPDGFVIWTRLGPDPLAEDGLGGMPDKAVPVQWEVAEDEHFHKVVKRGTSSALAELAHSVHVEVHGLKPGSYYWYRFKAGREISRTGRTKTAPAPHADIKGMSFALASCQAWYHGYFTAYRHMAEDHPDVVFFLGDYIYEYAINAKNLFRDVTLSAAHNAKTVTLSQYRLRYSLLRQIRTFRPFMRWLPGL